MTDLYRKYRPRTLKEVVGQPDAVKVLSKCLENGGLPNALLLTGPTGVGKTTIAHALARHLEAGNELDCADINCAVTDPMDTVREIAGSVHYHPSGGKNRVWILEEFQSLSRATFAQQGMLRVLETAPPHNYFVLCATDAKKIIPAVRGRCMEVRLGPIPSPDLHKIVVRVASAENRKGTGIGSRVVDRIVDMAEGSARNALVLLGKIIGLEDEKDQLTGLDRTDPGKVAFDLVKTLLPFKGSPNWKEVAAVLKSIEGEEPEGVRQLVLTAARTALFRGDRRARGVIEAFREPFFNQKAGDNALLAAACWDCCAPNP